MVIYPCPSTNDWVNGSLLASHEAESRGYNDCKSFHDGMSSWSWKRNIRSINRRIVSKSSSVASAFRSSSSGKFTISSFLIYIGENDFFIKDCSMGDAVMVSPYFVICSCVLLRGCGRC